MWPFTSTWEIELSRKRDPKENMIFPEVKYVVVRAKTSTSAMMKAIMNTPGLWHFTSARKIR